MFERILLPLDGSELSEMSLPYGEELAGKLGSEIVLYHVNERAPAAQEHMYQLYLEKLADIVRHDLSSKMPKGKELKVTTKVETGEPKANICNFVDSNKIDLIVMSAVSVSGLKVGKMLGSVTDHVCQLVPIPVMLIRPQTVKTTTQTRPLFNNILVPLDGSDLSKLALPVGEDLAQALKMKISLFRMSNMVRFYDDGTGSGAYAYIDYAKLNDDEKARVTARMAELAKEVKSRGLEVNTIVISSYDAASEIIEACKKNNIDLVVMSTHGQSGLGRFVFGSVAEKVLRHGETPLLLVHARAG
jgi:nucleotide-binding universal stress UspA family protein